MKEAGGNGIYAKILKNTVAAWPERLVTYGKKESHDTTISVKKGDSICFTVKRNGEKPAKKTLWDPTITYVDTENMAK